MVSRSRSYVRRALFIAAVMLAVQLQVIAIVPSPARALNYNFAVQEEDVTVQVLPDGGITIDYSIKFVNYGELDGVDIGLPNSYYDKNSATASVVVDGATYPITDIVKSPYVGTGLAVNFDSDIRSHIEVFGTIFTLKFHVKNPHMVYENELKSGTVGIRFRPTWFDPTFQQGPTDHLSTKIFFPPAFQDISQAVYLKNRPWNAIYLDKGTGMVVAVWNDSYVSSSSLSSGSYDSGVGFPKQYVDKYFKHDWWEDFQNTFAALGDLCVVIAPCLLFAGVFAGIIILGYVSQRKRAKDYFEPKLTVKGAGPRRDLTAVEAAIVLELPLSMVATMILFGLLKKGKLQVVGENPMTLRRISPTGDYPYETAYINAISPAGLMNRSALSTALVDLVKDVQTKVQGFDYDATKEYYRAICERAWSQVRAAGTPEQFSNDLDKMNDWMMLDNNYYHRMDGIYVGLPYYVPVQTGTRTSHAGAGWAKSGGLNPQQAAQRYVSQVKTASQNLTSNMKSLSRDVTGVTHPVPVSSGGGGCAGGGCACACACACAGGGR